MRETLHTLYLRSASNTISTLVFVFVFIVRSRNPRLLRHLHFSKLPIEIPIFLHSPRAAAHRARPWDDNHASSLATAPAFMISTTSLSYQPDLPTLADLPVSTFRRISTHRQHALAFTAALAGASRKGLQTTRKKPRTHVKYDDSTQVDGTHKYIICSFPNPPSKSPGAPPIPTFPSQLGQNSELSCTVLYSCTLETLHPQQRESR